MKKYITLIAVTAVFAAGCGSAPVATKPVATPKTPQAVPIKQTGLLSATKLRACLKNISADPVVSTDNQLYAPLVQDPDFSVSFDAWRNDYSPEGYASIYIWVYRTAEGAKRARAAQEASPDGDFATDEDYGPGLPQADNVLWNTELGMPSAEQAMLMAGCFTKARS